MNADPGSLARQGVEYRYDDAGLNSSHRYLLPAVLRLLESRLPERSPRRVFDLGCGNGSVAAHLAALGFDVTGVDPSDDAIAHGRMAYPALRLAQRSAYDDLAAEFGQFPAVLCMEVIEHVYAPRRLLAAAHALLEPGGMLILTTPYHGYLKNLALALTGAMERHFDVLTDHGHIKFFSRATLAHMLDQTGFTSVRIDTIGRIPPLAKSLVATASR